MNRVNPNKFAQAGFLAIMVSFVLIATIPFVADPLLKTAPWGQPQLASPYVQATLDDRLVFTYYFYWYDWDSGMHFYGGGCDDHNTYHPVDQTEVSYKDPDWHYREFKDMMAAGIDVFLPVFWGGNPGSGLNDSWSKQGLGPMQIALNRLQAEYEAQVAAGTASNPLGVTNPVPKIGMFFDTTAMCIEYHDPTQPFGSACTGDLTNTSHCETFYLMIKDFFAPFEEDHIEQVPNAVDPSAASAYIVWLYGDNWFANVDQVCFDYCKERFLADFNHTLVFVGTPGWAKNGCNNIEGIYRWGTSVGGLERIDDPETPIDIVSLGPGFNNGNETQGAVCQVGQNPMVTPRSPEFYSANWTRAIAMDPNWIVVETWNELHEGTVICRTVEHGDTYINLTGQYSKEFHAKAIPEEIPRLDPPIYLGFSSIALFAAGIVYSKKSSNKPRDQAVNQN